MTGLGLRKNKEKWQISLTICAKQGYYLRQIIEINIKLLLHWRYDKDMLAYDIDKFTYQEYWKPNG